MTTLDFAALQQRRAFSGEFPAEQPAIMVDDTLTQGGTFASLKGHLEQQGGKIL